MPELVLPGVYIDVRDEGLITPGRITVGNIGMVGTASKGEVGKAVLVSSATDARDRFGPYDAFIDGRENELSLVRAIELAYDNGASTVWAVRIAGGTPATATFSLAGTSGETAKLEALSPGTWGNNIGANVAAAEDGAFVQNETHAGGAATVTLDRKPVAKVSRNRVRINVDALGQTKELLITYGSSGTPPSGSALINDATGVITFAAADAPAAADKVVVNYEVPAATSAKVTLKAGTLEEAYTVADGAHLVEQLNQAGSASQLVKGQEGANSAELPTLSSPADKFELLGKGTNTPGSNGEAVTDADVKNGLVPLLNESVHIVVAAGMSAGAGKSNAVGDELKAHCDVASTDKMKADRIAVVGSFPKASFDDAQSPGVDSDRVVFVAPGFIATDSVSRKEVKFPGAYTAAVLAGMLSANDPHISLTNKPLAVGALETRFTQPQLTQLVQNHVLACEEQRGRGVRVVKAITTSSNSAFHQITTRRIVDFAKYGVRSAASPYIGRLNNERVRAALKTTVVSFLQEMLDDEMLVAFEVDVFATRADEIKGIANVTISLQPTFSIDFIKVTMFLS